MLVYVEINEVFKNTQAKVFNTYNKLGGAGENAMANLVGILPQLVATSQNQHRCKLRVKPTAKTSLFSSDSDWVSCVGCLQRTHASCLTAPPVEGDAAAGPRPRVASHTCAKCLAAAEWIVVGDSDVAPVVT
jgi:hypothetical protein